MGRVQLLQYGKHYCGSCSVAAVGEALLWAMFSCCSRGSIIVGPVAWACTKG